MVRTMLSMLRIRDLSESSDRPHFFVFRYHRDYLRSLVVIVDMSEVSRVSAVRRFHVLVRSVRICGVVVRRCICRHFLELEFQDRFELRAVFVGYREYREWVPFCVHDGHSLG